VDLDFYSTAAQVIPLLFITLAIDLRGFVVSPIDRTVVAWTEVRGEHEPRLVKAEAEVKMAERKVALHRDLSPEEVFAIVADATRTVRASFDSAENPLREKARKARIAAACLSVFAMLALILGEAVALRVLEVRQGTQTASGLVESALWLGAGLLCWRVVDRVFDTVDEENRWAIKHRHVLPAIAAGLGLAATYIAWHAF
jgi:hypothetical protein